MKFLVRGCTAIFAVAVILAFAGCDGRSVRLNTDADTVVYRPGDAVTVDFSPADTVLEADTASMPEALPPPDTASESDTDPVSDISPLPETSCEETGTVVYWVKSGEVWHTTEKCPSLSRSKGILSGSVSEAMTAGKDRVCKRCP